MGVVSVRTMDAPKIQTGVSVRHPTILVYLETCDWLEDCTTGVIRVVLSLLTARAAMLARSWES